MNQDYCSLHDPSIENGPAPNRVMRRSIRQLSSDVITLAELQTELLKVDLKDWSKSIIRACVAGAAALVILLASLPVLLISLGYFLEQWTELSLGASMLAAAGVGVLIAAICGSIALWSLKRDQTILQRFSEELRKNIRWLKEVLSNPSSVDANTLS